MLFQEAPPDTSAYMIAGYAVFFVVSAIYLFSLIVRHRNLSMDLKTLESLQAENRSPTPRSAAANPAARSTERTRPARKRKAPAKKKVSRRR